MTGDERCWKCGAPPSAIISHTIQLTKLGPCVVCGLRVNRSKRATFTYDSRDPSGKAKMAMQIADARRNYAPEMVHAKCRAANKGGTND